MVAQKLFIKADGYGVCFKTNCAEAASFVENNMDEFIRLTISFIVSRTEVMTDISFTYNNTDGYNLRFDKNAKELYLECPWNKINKSTFLPMIFRYIVEWLRQNNQEIKVHASAIVRGNKTALFMAPTEGGKTTTALAMCQKFGCSLRANDAAVLKFDEEMPLMLRGDTIIKVRYNGLEAYSKEIYEDRVDATATDENPWFKKMKILPDEIGITSNKGVSAVTNLFFIKLDVLVNGCSVTHYNDNNYERKEHWFKPKMQLLQNIAGTIRGTDLIPLGNDGNLLPIVIPSLDNDELCLNRIKFINSLFESCDIYQLRGQLDSVTKHINDILSSKV